MLSCMFPCPSLLHSPMIHFPGSLSKLSHHPHVSTCSFVFYGWNNSVSKKDEGVLKSNGNGRHWESPNQIQPPCWRRIQTSLAFLHVPIPTALRPSHSSSSWLTTNTMFPFYIYCLGSWYLMFIHIMLISQALRKGKENLRALGIGGIRKTLNQISISNVIWSRDYAFLHVPIPSALRYFSSFSWLTL